MKSNALIIVRFVLALLTLLALVVQPYIPPKKILIHPLDATYESIFGEEGKYNWIADDDGMWRCDYQVSEGDAKCGFTLSWEGLFIKRGQLSSSPVARTIDCDAITPENPELNEPEKCFISGEARPICSSSAEDPDGDGWGWENDTSCVVVTPQEGPHKVHSIDLSDYDGLNVRIHYEGRARYLTVYIGNYTPELSVDDPSLPDKSMTALVHTRDLKAGDAFIKFSEFNVDEWWIRSNDVPRHLAIAQFNRVRSMGVTQSESGIHKTRIDKIEVVGQRISVNQMVFTLALFWFIYFLSEAAFKYIQLRAATAARKTNINKLTTNTVELESEKKVLAKLSITDSLTGILNRNGIQPFIDSLFSAEGNQENLSILVIDIDHFKEINDTHGHDTGDSIIQAVVNVIAPTLRKQDLFARWGGEEFVVILIDTPGDNASKVANKIINTIAQHRFLDENLTVTVSIGVTTARQGELFDTYFKRADIALYKAKNQRNCAFYQSPDGA